MGECAEKCTAEHRFTVRWFSVREALPNFILCVAVGELDHPPARTVCAPRSARNTRPVN